MVNLICAGNCHIQEKHAILHVFYVELLSCKKLYMTTNMLILALLIFLFISLIHLSAYIISGVSLGIIKVITNYIFSSRVTELFHQRIMHDRAIGMELL